VEIRLQLKERANPRTQMAEHGIQEFVASLQDNKNAIKKYGRGSMVTEAQRNMTQTTSQASLNACVKLVFTGAYCGRYTT
jgi:hypothetical protein